MKKEYIIVVVMLAVIGGLGYLVYRTNDMTSVTVTNTSPPVSVSTPTPSSPPQTTVSTLVPAPAVTRTAAPNPSVTTAKKSVPQPAPKSLVAPSPTNTSQSTQVTAAQLREDIQYSQAMQQYGDFGLRRRFQVMVCATTSPGNMVLKLGEKFMIDNRDLRAHTFVLGSQKVRVNAQDFAIMTAAPVGTWTITCDGGGATTITVAK